MQRPALRAISKRLAFGPAVFMLALALPAQAADKKASDVHRVVVREEASIAKAISSRNGKTLERSIGVLGKHIEDAIARRERGENVTSCDVAAHSLAFAAVSTVQSLAQSGQESQVLLDDARAAAADFRKDMQACEKLIGKSVGGHTSVEKALKAL